MPLISGLFNPVNISTESGSEMTSKQEKLWQGRFAEATDAFNKRLIQPSEHQHRERQ